MDNKQELKEMRRQEKNEKARTKYIEKKEMKKISLILDIMEGHYIAKIELEQDEEIKKRLIDNYNIYLFETFNNVELKKAFFIQHLL